MYNSTIVFLDLSVQVKKIQINYIQITFWCGSKYTSFLEWYTSMAFQKYPRLNIIF